MLKYMSETTCSKSHFAGIGALSAHHSDLFHAKSGISDA